MTTTVPRKTKKNNIGQVNQPVTIDSQGAYRPVLNVERYLKSLLEETTKMFVEDRAECVRFFSWWFDTTLDDASLQSFVNAFIMRPPLTVLGYARAGAELPTFAIVMTNEDESDSYLADFVGDHGIGRDSIEYTGALFDAQYAIYIYTDNPDVCALLYQYVKAVVHAGKTELLDSGVVGISLSGGDLAPDENYMPEHMYVRTVRLNMKHPFSAPRIRPFDRTKVKVSGLFQCDVVVDGQRGAVHTYVEGEE